MLEGRIFAFLEIKEMVNVRGCKVYISKRSESSWMCPHNEIYVFTEMVIIRKDQILLGAFLKKKNDQLICLFIY